MPGRVVGEHRSHFQRRHRRGRAVGGADRPPAQCRRAALRPAGRRRLRCAAACRQATAHATIEEVLPRTSALVRKASGEERPQLLGSERRRRLHRHGAGRRFQSAAHRAVAGVGRRQRRRPGDRSQQGRISADDVAGMTDQIATIAPGVPVHAISARAGDGIAAIEQYFAGNRTVGLIGSSGVGKSTLTNELLGRAAQATQEVRAHDSRGRHTTTHRQLFLRPHGGSIIDTPGMRGVERWLPAESRKQLRRTSRHSRSSASSAIAAMKPSRSARCALPSRVATRCRARCRLCRRAREAKSSAR